MRRPEWWWWGGGGGGLYCQFGFACSHGRSFVVVITGPFTGFLGVAYCVAGISKYFGIALLLQ